MIDGLHAHLDVVGVDEILPMFLLLGVEGQFAVLPLGDTSLSGPHELFDRQGDDEGTLAATCGVIAFILVVVDVVLC